MMTLRSRFVVSTAAVGAVAGALALAGAAGAVPATAPVLPARGIPIADSYVVMLKDGAASPASVRSAARDLAGRHAGTVTFTYTRAVRGFAVRMTEARVRRLAADPRVASVQQDARMYAIGTQRPAPWGLDRVDQRTLPLNSLYAYPDPATTVRAYVIDTGIRTSHTDFGGRALVGFDAVRDGRNGQDCNGHGTHVAGILGGARYGVAKATRLYAVRVLSCSGSGSNAAVLAGVDWVTAHAVKPAVANMSLGGGASAALDQAVRNSISSGVTYAVAAGNNGANACNSSPARTAEAITVGSTTSTDARSAFSNYGSCLDIFAPGSDIPSAWYANDVATATRSGTSMASPHVAGAAALHLAANPAALPAAVRNALVAAGTRGLVGNPGTGSPNVLLYTGPSGTAQPPPSPPPPPPPPPPAGSFTNDTDVAIPDAGGAVISPIRVTGRSGAAPAALRVTVSIVHPYRGDLVVDLLAPDWSAYRLKSASAFDSADNVTATYTVNASTEAASGVWRLRVRDVYPEDVGYLNSWRLTF